MRTIARLFTASALISMIATLSPSSADAQVSDAEIREVLMTSKAANVLESVPGQITALVAGTQPGRDTAVINAAVRKHFAVDTLLAHVAAALKSQAEPKTFRALRQWILADSIRALEAKGDVISDQESLEQYAARVTANRPPQDRILLAGQFLEAQNAGEFYVQLVNALRSGAAEIGRAAQSRGTLPAALTDQDAEQIRLQFSRVTILAFLQRLEPLSNVEAQRLITAYESESGQWYVDAYINAVGSAIQKAATATAAELR